MNINDALPIHPHLVHPLTGQPLRAIGVLPSGKVCWPVIGASEPAGGGPAAPAPAPPSAPAPKAGKTFTQAELDAVIADRLTRDRGKYADYDTIKAKAEAHDKAEADKAPELERATKTARKEGEDAVRAELTRERVLDKIEVAAAGRFTDPEDARLRLGARADEFIKDGQPDPEAIKAAVDKLLVDKPHLAAVATADAGRAGLGGQGADNGGEPVGVTPGQGRLAHAYSTSSTTKKK